MKTETNCPTCGSRVNVGGDGETHYYVPLDAPAAAEVNADGLLPCPFCGPGMSQVSLYKNEYDRWQVGCGACGSHTGTCATAERATTLWNTRAAGGGG